MNHLPKYDYAIRTFDVSKTQDTTMEAAIDDIIGLMGADGYDVQTMTQSGNSLTILFRRPMAYALDEAAGSPEK